MSGVEDPDTVDLVAEDANGTYMMVMVEDRPWREGTVQEQQLKDKINGYLGFVQDGQLADKFPESAGKPLQFRIDCVEEPHGEFLRIIQHGAGQLAQFGIDVEVVVRPLSTSDSGE